MKYLIVSCFCLLVLLSCNTSASNKKGMEIFNAYCASCHGKDGKLGLNDSKDLTASLLTLEEITNLVQNGKGMMTPFKSLLSDEDIRAVSEYALKMQE